MFARRTKIADKQTLVEISQPICRQFSSNSTTPSQGLKEVLVEQTPSIKGFASRIQCLHAPDQFYGSLINGIRNAQNRIVLSALYLGTDDLENEMVNELIAAAKRNPDLKIQILLDHFRAQRTPIGFEASPENTNVFRDDPKARDSVNNSVRMLLPLLEASNNVQLSLYHTPDLTGLLKKLIPPRYNETVGINHLKAFIFDNDLVMSGANLSHDYFTNREDRYLAFGDHQDLSQFYSDLVSLVAEHGFRVTPLNPQTLAYKLHYGSKFSSQFSDSINPEENSTKFKRSLSTCLINAFNPESPSLESPNQDHDTWIFPTVQWGPGSVMLDENITRSVIHSTLHRDNHLHLSSAYFNFTSEYEETIFSTQSGKAQIVTAAPEANGFFQAKGFAGGLPFAYSRFEEQFFNRIQNLDMDNRIQVHEYKRDGWTFHVKGLWCSDNDNNTYATMVGSPNFGRRSVRQDLESQLVVVTENPSLQNQLQYERDRVFQSHTTRVDQSTFDAPDRQTPTWVKAASGVFRNYL